MSAIINLRRKGVAYTIVTIILLIAISAMFFTQSRRTGHEVQSATAERIRSLDTFLNDLGQDSTRAAQIAGFRTMIAMEQHIATNGEYFPQPNTTFKEIFLTGTLENETFLIMENSSFNEYLARVSAEAGSQGITMSAGVENIYLWQADPWHVNVNYTLSINITDNRGTASWRVNRTFTGEVPITDLRDPLFTVETLSRVQRVIKKTNISMFVDDGNDANDTSGLLSHFNRSQYTAAGRGPNMLMRFSGNNSDDIYGIESLVDIEEISAQNLNVNSQATVVDYLYFNNTPASACAIQNLPTRIKIDDAHLETYEIEGTLTYSACP